MQLDIAVKEHSFGVCWNSRKYDVIENNFDEKIPAPNARVPIFLNS